jgi:hypothetical protein
MKTKLTTNNIRTGEALAFRLFQTEIAVSENGWIAKNKALGYRGRGRAMIRSVYAVARHIEGARLSKALAKKGVDSVSLSAVRTALKKLGDGLVTAREEHHEVSKGGGRLARFIKAAQ